MKEAIMFGAGGIGRGFIGALLEKSGWHVTFADVVEPIIHEINTRKHYTVHILDQECENWEIQNVSAVLSTGEDVVKAIAACDLITTAVGPLVAPIIAKPIAAGIKARMAAGNKAPMNVVCCENGLRTTTRLKGFVVEHLSGEEKAFAEAYVGFADCAVDRICPKSSFENPLDAAVERYMEWDVERSAWKGETPEIQGLTFVDNLLAYLERKLFTLNSGHAVCAYLGRLRGHKTILESIQDPAVGAVVHAAMCESGEGLIKEFNFDADKHHAYIEKIFSRFHNPYLQDEVERVGREPIRKLDPADRLIKPLATAASYGLPVDHLLFGAAAAMRFDCPEDPQSVELMQKIKTSGPAAALAAYTGFQPENPLFGRILDVYRALALV
ncbi:MAG: mannitol-1-phosphate 5-dehydrogenase [Oscillibacter sp.]|jgi:mannitol-1-phosphate 5-dehydrogenase|nr:mannitol-1-phosphate 5-dehydrogenase [Oscillibacter sp.]